MSAYPPVAPNSTVRRMRRSRDVVGSSGEGDFQSGYDLYSIQGDAAGALKVFQQQQQQKRQQNLDETNKADNFKDNVSLASKYNCMLLSQIASKKKKTVSQQSKEVLLSKLDELDALFVIAEKEKQKDEEKLSGPRKLVPNDFILVYNRMLVLHSTGDVRVCAQLCFEKISSIIDHFQNKSDNTTKDIDAEKHRQITSSMLLSDDVAVVVARIAFLLLECILCISVGRNGGLKSITSSIGIPSVEIILDWLESLPVVNSGTSGGSNLDSQNKDPQLKFLFNLYKSRLALADLDVNTGKHVEANIRSARKDMKTAMEVFQQKLRPSIGTETASVVSSVNSEENVSLNGSSNNRQDSQSAFPSNVVLQKLNQSALSLKAHLEQLKGNTKKSLILCSEAVGVDESTSINVGYDAVHSNNLAVIYETNDKRHLALHALAKSLRATSIENGSPSDENDKNINDNDQDSSRSSLFYSDGTVRPKMTLSILHNAAICSLRARNYLSAYECIATCVTKSEIFYNRPTSWLRMAESCIGIWTINRRSTHGSKFDTVSIEG